MRNLRELFVVIGIVLVLTTALVAVQQRMTEADRRAQCARNLKQIGRLMLMYDQIHRGSYPRGPYDPKSTKLVYGTPYDENGKPGPANGVAEMFKSGDPHAVEPNDVTVFFFILMRTMDATSDLFVCPSTGQKPFDFGGGANTAMNWSNFPGKAAIRNHLSYSVHAPYPNTPAREGEAVRHWNIMLGASDALVADMNPGRGAMAVTLKSNETEVRRGNSLNHGQQGQNVLFGDGHIAFHTSPFVGDPGDNMYTYGLSGYTENPDGRRSMPTKPSPGDGIEGPPVHRRDAVLLPTAEWAGITATPQQLRERSMHPSATRPSR